MSAVVIITKEYMKLALMAVETSGSLQHNMGKRLVECTECNISFF